ncbi:MAG TPA: hypothetical protein VK563_10660 [Puia sp.]|nr:hypothetical protein [Puia sp.]
MDDPFIITITHNGTEKNFEASLQVFGYSHRFHVLIEGTDILFERDEEGQYRAIIPAEKEPKDIDKSLLESIAKAIEGILA